MKTPRSLIGLTAVAAAALVLWTSPSSIAQDKPDAKAAAPAGEKKPRSKVYPLSGKPFIVEDVQDLGTEYQVTEIFVGSSGKESRIGRKIAKTQVSKIEALDAAKPAEADGAAAGGLWAPITDAMVQQILGSDNIEFSALDQEDVAIVDVEAPLGSDQRSVNEMQRIAGIGKANVYETPHFVFVYTSEKKLAADLAANLERIYRWVVKFNEMMGVRSIRPENKLEVFFFGTYKEYEAYMAHVGSIMQGALGFYMRDKNRSAFFDLNDDETIKALKDQSRQLGIDAPTRRRILNRLQRRMTYLNYAVVQHEAAHHIHFNVGTFPKKGDIPRWMSEGLAQMFETPYSDAGASLGAINHFRLNEFKLIYGPKGERAPDLKIVILNDGWFFQNGGAAYSMGWALNYYLFNKKREGYTRWMQLMANREWGEDVTVTERQRQFEELFGEIDDDWAKVFLKFITDINIDTSVLPEP